MEFRRILQKRSKGFSLIEMIAALVLVSILVPGISLIVRGTMMNIAFTNMAVFANMEADYAQRNFIKHINGVKSFSATPNDLDADNLKFTSYLDNAVYAYQIDTDGSRTIKYSKDGGTAGILLQKVVKDTTIDAVNYVSKFTYKDNNNNNLSVPVASYTGINVAFNSVAKSINVPSGNSFEYFVVGNKIRVSSSGVSNNEGIFTIASLTDNNTIVVSESIMTEGVGPAITVSTTEVHGVELTFYLLRGESFYKYTTYATIDEDQLDI